MLVCSAVLNSWGSVGSVRPQVGFRGAASEKFCVFALLKLLEIASLALKNYLGERKRGPIQFFLGGSVGDGVTTLGSDASICFVY